MITEGALIKRINRRLAHEGARLRKTRKWNSDLGDYYLVDIRSNAVLARHCDLDDLGCELEVLDPFEPGTTTVTLKFGGPVMEVVEVSIDSRKPFAEVTTTWTDAKGRVRSGTFPEPDLTEVWKGKPPANYDNVIPIGSR